MSNADYHSHLNRKRNCNWTDGQGHSSLNKPLSNPFGVGSNVGGFAHSGSQGSAGSEMADASGRHKVDFYGWDSKGLGPEAHGTVNTDNAGFGGNGNNGLGSNAVPIGGIRNNDINDNLFSNLSGAATGSTAGDNSTNGNIGGVGFLGNSNHSLGFQSGNSLSGYIGSLNSTGDFDSKLGSLGGEAEASKNPPLGPQYSNHASGSFGIPSFNNNATSQLVMGIVSNTVRETTGLNSEKISQLQLWFPQTIASLKSHFAVSHEYVLKKLLFMICPYITLFTSTGGVNIRTLSYENYQTSVSSGGESDTRTLPTFFPDLYIPLMGFITYVLADGVINGVFSRFNPQMLGSTATFSIVLLITEVILFQLGSYIFAGRVLTTLDLFSSMGYKYTSIVLCDIILLFIGGRKNHMFWFFFFYISLSSSLVVYLTLKVISSHNLCNQYSVIQQSGLTLVILIFSVVQVPLCWVLLPST